MQQKFYTPVITLIEQNMFKDNHRLIHKTENINDFKFIDQFIELGFIMQSL